MNKNTWKLLEEAYKQFPQSKCLNSEDIAIEKAETELGLIFSETYKYFLRNHQCSSIGELWINTLTRAEDSPTSLWSVTDSTNWYKNKQNWPGIEDWYIVSDNGSGDPIGINTKGEVWISYHDSGFEQEKLANNFEEFVYKLLTETLWG